jgi:hypothetical protein
MNTLRSETVIKAKANGICTQCLKQPAMGGRLQCERCIETNKRKRIKRKDKYAEYQARNWDKNIRTPERKAVLAFCIAHNICTRCMGRPTTSGRRNCEICLERKAHWKRLAKQRQT